MSMLKSRLMSVVIGAAVVVGTANLTAYAANGHPLLLGHANAESRTATVGNSGRGPALSLKSAKRSPSLAVSSSKKIKHLNADKVDGRNASRLQTRATTWTIPGGTKLAYSLHGLKPGTYLATMDILLLAATPSACFLDEPGQPGVQAFGANRGATFSQVSGAGIIEHAAGGQLSVTCSDATSVDGSTPTPSTITFVRLDRVSKGTVTAQ